MEQNPPQTPAVPERTIDEMRRHGPTVLDGAVRLHSEAVGAELDGQRDLWRRGFTRRRLLAGAGAVAVAGLGSQLVTSKVSFAAQNTTDKTLIMVFLRGGVDGLSVVVPRGDRNYLDARRDVAVGPGALLAGDDRFGLHPALAPLVPLWNAGTMAAVHAVSGDNISRSHFQATDCIERGAASPSVRTGWLERVLGELGPGTTFRAVAEGGTVPRSMIGSEAKVVMHSLKDLHLATWEGVRERSLTALKGLYTGLDHPEAVQTTETLAMLAAARELDGAAEASAATWPEGEFAAQMRNLATLIKAKAGLRVASVDVGGWDMHTNIGTPDKGDMHSHLTYLSTALAAFAAELGPAFADVNVVLMSEFGRRVEVNGSSGFDHGRGGLMMLLGGGLRGGRVHGAWPGLAADALDEGDLAGANDYRDVLGELLTKRLGLGSTNTIFPDHAQQNLGVFT
ncbi:DUF1501 domain-containing protein [Saccharothrix hoggarensis]|uniref:DUF1501 domain-containing protein n=1 Tax=Saccharothrix hoggarensis TaxID=913853 RepID=A0ABW3QQ11_9PSEU